MMYAIYCRNGHYIGLVEGSYFSEGATQAFCTKCGAETLQGCLSCNAQIPHPRYGSDQAAYCGSCGKPFPWTETALAAAKEYTDELEALNDDEKATLKASFDDLTVDTPRTELAASRFKRIMGKIGPAAGDVLTKIMVNVATEAAKKGMGI
jgi:hypothetical protein